MPWRFGPLLRPLSGSSCRAQRSLPLISRGLRPIIMDEGIKMLRIAVSLYLMFAALVGPGLCCCTFTRLWTSQSHGQQVAQTERQVPSCCRHCREVPPSREQPTQPEKPPCPCKSNQGTATAILPSHSEAGGNQYSADLVQKLVAVTNVPPCTNLTAATALHQSPDLGMSGFLDSQDMLRALHILLC